MLGSLVCATPPIVRNNAQEAVNQSTLPQTRCSDAAAQMQRQTSETVTYSLQLSRRNLLVASPAAIWASAFAIFPVAPAAAAADGEDVLTVGPAGNFATISAALEASQPNTTILIAPGRYNERLVITKPVSLRPSGNDGSTASNQLVEVSWQTSKPYESTIEVTSNDVAISGFAIKHTSPSIAQNYAVKIVGCSGVLLEQCDITSTTGSAIGIEGGTATIIRACTIHDCKRNGIMVLPDIEGTGGDAKIQNCSIVNNTLHGVLVRDGAAPQVVDNDINGNAGFGLALQGAGGAYENNRGLYRNKSGAAAYNLLADGLEAENIATANGLQASDMKEIAL